MKIEVGKYYHVTQKDSVAYISNLLIDKSTGKKIYQGNLYEGTDCSKSQWDQEGINLCLDKDHYPCNLHTEIEDPIGYIFQKVLVLRNELSHFEKSAKDRFNDQSIVINNLQWDIGKINTWNNKLVEKLNNQKWFTNPFRTP